MILSDQSLRWFETLQDLEHAISREESSPKYTYKNDLGTFRHMGANLFKKENCLFDKSILHASESQWVNTIKKHGSNLDKFAGAVICVENSAIHSLTSLDFLISEISKPVKTSKKIRTELIRILQELFSKILLPERKLRFFEQQCALLHVLPIDEFRDRLLILFYFEGCVKRRYMVFLKVLDELSMDNLEYVRIETIKTAYELLDRKPEQESALIALLVNKLGDSNRNIAKRTICLILSVLKEHPKMSFFVASIVEKFIKKAPFKNHGRYNSIILLNKLKHSQQNNGFKLAHKLIDTYFLVFELILKFGTTFDTTIKKHSHKEKKFSRTKKLKVYSKTMSVLLFGVNQALPFSLTEKIKSLSTRYLSHIFHMAQSPFPSIGLPSLILLKYLI